MKVKELMKLLEGANPESDVILQKDSEGNGYSPLADVDSECVYIQDSTWGGSVYSMEWTADDACMDEEEWQVIKSNPRCVVLAPIN